MGYIIIQIVALLAVVAVAILLIIYNSKDYKYCKKIEFLTYLVDKGYESNKIDLNKL